jgi:F0F1-type ATP synthase membrane subunit c/vacuolar-type H+-ATPase subunit K
MNRNPEFKNKIMSFMILFLALIEVIAIYGLLTALSILNKGAPVVEVVAEVIVK